MTSHKSSSAYASTLELVNALVQNGPLDAVVSPGSRNAPIIAALAHHEKVNVHSVIDERSAAFQALGMAKASGHSVILCCTSGTALLNYYPAIAEAYYSRVPLIILSADRPKEKIDQWDGQAIRQTDVFINHVRGSFTTEGLNAPLDFWKLGVMVRKELVQNINGPYHINVPIDEPFYTGIDFPAESFTKVLFKNIELIAISLAELCKKYSIDPNSKIMIIHGCEDLDSVEVTGAENSVVLTDIASNKKGNVPHWEALTLSSKIDTDFSQYCPDILITTGTSIVNRNIKQWIKQKLPRVHLHVSRFMEIGNPWGTDVKSVVVNNQKSSRDEDVFGNKAYLENWQSAALHNWKQISIDSGALTEWNVCQWILDKTSKGTILHLANSMPIRWIGLLSKSDNRHQIMANRGTSGIDGFISTAVGYTKLVEEQNIVITGDLSFFYDSNALMHTDGVTDLKIIILNNGGGQIFKAIHGPEKMGEAQKYQITEHGMHAKHLANHFGIDYINCSDLKQFKEDWNRFMEFKGISILEVFIDQEASLEQYQRLKEEY